MENDECCIVKFDFNFRSCKTFSSTVRHASRSCDNRYLLSLVEPFNLAKMCCTFYSFLEKRRQLKLAIQGTSGASFGFNSPIPSLQSLK